jgi:tricorn protease-like protein
MHIDTCENRRWVLRAALLSYLLVGLPLFADANGIDINNTRLLSHPAISKDHVAFTYAGDLWVAGLDGKSVKRLTADDGQQGFPAFSPDGSLIAFTAQYEGNPDVYVVPVAGGVPTRLTWHRDRTSFRDSHRMELRCSSRRRARLYRPVYAAIHGSSQRRHRRTSEAAERVQGDVFA